MGHCPRITRYGYDEDTPVSVSVDATTILSGATYEPFGPVNGWAWGNATAHSRTYDLRGLMDSHLIATDTRTLGYDAAGWLKTLDDARHDLDFDYNALGQITDFTAAGLASLTAQGLHLRRKRQPRDPGTECHDVLLPITANTNRLASTTGPVAKTITYDAAGNTTADGANTYGYDDRGRLTSIVC